MECGSCYYFREDTRNETLGYCYHPRWSTDAYDYTPYWIHDFCCCKEHTPNNDRWRGIDVDCAKFSLDINGICHNFHWCVQVFGESLECTQTRRMPCPWFGDTGGGICRSWIKDTCVKMKSPYLRNCPMLKPVVEPEEPLVEHRTLELVEENNYDNSK